MNCLNRTKYHFYRAVKVGLVERQRVQRHKALVDQRLSTAMAKKEGHSRLIRTVMHDLRSPLLSVANSAAVLAEMDVTTRLDDPVVTECHAAIATCSELMQNIVSDMGSGGSGLNLTIVREIVRLYAFTANFHDTRHWPMCLPSLPVRHRTLDSAGLGRGATLKLELVLPKAGPDTREEQFLLPAIRLPAISTLASPAIPSLVIAATTSAVTQAYRAPPSSRPRRWPPGFWLLHVEDDALLRKSFELRVLKKLQVPFDVAEHGAKAVVLCDNCAYTEIIMDNQMPVLTGEMATRQLRASGYTGTIIGMTGDPSGCHERSAFEVSGLNICVDKDTHGVFEKGNKRKVKQTYLAEQKSEAEYCGQLFARFMQIG
ncbi:hypothetical protein T492DRAFT_833704 [Pavlovales sp. CCMP2436]|nr:hypothetical protein T492DRAFT_833704 [Pavlovales sp. CCMP2436]